MTVDLEGSARVDLVDGLDEAREAWVALALASRNVFSTWEWAVTWWRQRDESRRLLVHVGREPDGRVSSLLPLYQWSSRPFRIARFLGHGPADQLGPVCAASDARSAARALHRVLHERGLDLVLAELLPGGLGWSDELGSRMIGRESSPLASLEKGWEAFLAARSSNLRQQVRRRERRLADRYTLRYRQSADAERLDDDLSLLFSLHVARWGASSPFVRWERFHREFARVACERGWLRLWFLELDGRPVAAWYGFRFANVVSYYQAGREPARSDDSVGFVLLAHSIHEAAAEGASEYRFLRGAESFKLRFADADPGLETHAIALGLRGAAATAAVAAGVRSSRLRSAVRRSRARTDVE